MTTIYIAESVEQIKRGARQGNMFGFHSLSALHDALDIQAEQQLVFFEVEADGPILASNEGWYQFRAENIHSSREVGRLDTRRKPAPGKAKRQADASK